MCVPGSSHLPLPYTEITFKAEVQCVFEAEQPSARAPPHLSRDSGSVSSPEAAAAGAAGGCLPILFPRITIISIMLMRTFLGIIILATKQGQKCKKT